MKLVTLLLLCFVAGNVKGNTVNLNQLVDQLLASANELITTAGKETIPVPYVQGPFHKSTWWYSVTGTVTCQNGVVGQLNTLHRTGDATLTTQGNTVTLKASLGLGIFNFSFPICRAKAHLISIHGQTQGTVVGDSISFQISFTYGNQCSAKLDSISLDHIGQVFVNMGGGDFHKIEDALIEMLIHHFRDHLKDKVNPILQSTVGNAITKNAQKLCQAIPH